MFFYTGRCTRRLKRNQAIDPSVFLKNSPCESFNGSSSAMILSVSQKASRVGGGGSPCGGVSGVGKPPFGMDCNINTPSCRYNSRSASGES